MGDLGSKGLLRYLRTRKSLGKTAAIMAMCAACMADYLDRRVDWEIADCPLYPFMPYTVENRDRRGLAPSRR
jgi:hypothetical protein